MNVLHLTLSFSPGGRRTAIERLAQGLKSDGVDSHLACLDEVGCNLEQIDALFNSITVVGRSPRWSPHRDLEKCCRDPQIEVIHTHDAASQFAAARLRRRCPALRVLMTFHRSLPIESARWRDRLRNAYATAKSDAVVVGSTERRQHFRNVNWIRPEKVVLIPFGVETRRFTRNDQARKAVREELGVKSDTVVFGTVGHFGLEKGIDLALKAFLRLTADRPELSCALAICGTGKPDEEERLRGIVGNHHRVKWLGFRRDIERVMQGFDILVHAPRMEAFGLVLIEAMASGLPVISTAVGGTPDIVVDGVTGMLSPPLCVNRLAEAMQQLAASSTKRLRMGEAARQRAESEYSIELYAARHAQLYRAVLDQEPLPAFERTQINGANVSSEGLPTALVAGRSPYALSR